MARNIDPKCRQCRREGEKLFLKGEKCFTDKCAIASATFFFTFLRTRAAAVPVVLGGLAIYAFLYVCVDPGLKSWSPRISS